MPDAARTARSLAPVIWASSTFVAPSIEAGRRMATSTGATEFYSRYGNPTVNDFEEAIAELEGAEAARAFASGMGALSAVVLGLCSSGDHIVAQRQLYAGTQMLLPGGLPPVRDRRHLRRRHRPPGLGGCGASRPRRCSSFAETPANPRLDLVDLDRLGAIRGPMNVVDSTIATPLGQRPLDHGVDLVVHSATKAIGGHNDISLGVVAGSRELIDWVWGFAVLQGANASPTDAAGGLRGLRTLARAPRPPERRPPRRWPGRSRPTPGSSRVRHPSLASHPQHELAQRQMDRVVWPVDLRSGRWRSRPGGASSTRRSSVSSPRRWAAPRRS